jgi:hypothetical protein
MKNPIRPPFILELFWRERLVIEETAKFLDPVYFWEVQP